MLFHNPKKNLSPMDPEVRKRGQNLLTDLLAHNINQVQTIQRAATAEGLDLDPAKYVSPLPGNNTSYTSTQQASTLSMLGKVGGIWAFGVAALLGGVLLGNRGQAPAQPTAAQPVQVNIPPVAPPAVPQINPPKPLNLRVRWWVEGFESKAKVEEIKQGGT